MQSFRLGKGKLFAAVNFLVQSRQFRPIGRILSPGEMLEKSGQISSFLGSALLDAGLYFRHCHVSKLLPNGRWFKQISPRNEL